TSSTSARSPSRSSPEVRGPPRSVWRGLGRSSTRTAVPAASSPAARCDPTNPCPPVTSALFTSHLCRTSVLTGRKLKPSWSLRPINTAGGPRGFSRAPEVVEDDGVLVGVHAVPEALVAVGAELAGGGERLQRLALQCRVGADVGERGGLE